MEKEIADMTPLEAVAELRTWDHLFMSEKGVAAFNKAFGLDIKARTYRANPRDPKGLTLKDGAKSARGMCAADYADDAAKQLAGWKPWQSGRGFRLRSACDALEKHFSKAQERDEKTVVAEMQRGE